MSKVSTWQAPHRPEEEAPSSSAPLPMEADPSGFIERAPALASLLPDETLSVALARGDAFALHAALTTRFAREPAGPLRDALQKLLEDRTLYVVSERPPPLGGFLGTGLALMDLPPREKQQAPFIATRAVRFLGVPICSLGQHLVQRDRGGQLQVLGRVAATSGSRALRWEFILATGSLILAGAAAVLGPFVVREVHLVNGLPRPVEVWLEDRRITLKPGEFSQEQVYSLGAPHHVEARWPGAEQPFEELSVEASQRAVYNILGAAALQVDDALEQRLPRRLEGRAGSLEPDELMRWTGGWERAAREYADAGRWREAAELARSTPMRGGRTASAAWPAARSIRATRSP